MQITNNMYMLLKKFHDINFNVTSTFLMNLFFCNYKNCTKKVSRDPTWKPTENIRSLYSRRQRNLVRVDWLIDWMASLLTQGDSERLFRVPVKACEDLIYLWIFCKHCSSLSDSATFNVLEYFFNNYNKLIHNESYYLALENSK